jgi:hypothetical protein
MPCGWPPQLLCGYVRAVLAQHDERPLGFVNEPMQSICNPAQLTWLVCLVKPQARQPCMSLGLEARIAGTPFWRALTIDATGQLEPLGAVHISLSMSLAGYLLLWPSLQTAQPSYRYNCLNLSHHGHSCHFRSYQYVC